MRALKRGEEVRQKRERLAHGQQFHEEMYQRERGGVKHAREKREEGLDWNEWMILLPSSSKGG